MKFYFLNLGEKYDERGKKRRGKRGRKRGKRGKRREKLIRRRITTTSYTEGGKIYIFAQSIWYYLGKKITWKGGGENMIFVGKIYTSD